MASVTKSLFGSWPMLNMMLGVTLVSFAGYGDRSISRPPISSASSALDYATVGLIFGLIGGFSAGIGTLAGGFISDFAGKRDARWYALTPAIGLFVALPFYVGGYLMDDWKQAAIVLSLPAVFAYTYLAPTFAVVQNVVETRQRATAAAVMLLFLNIIALGGGPLFAGLVIDALGQFHFAHPRPARVPGSGRAKRPHRRSRRGSASRPPARADKRRPMRRPPWRRDARRPKRSPPARESWSPSVFMPGGRCTMCWRPLASASGLGPPGRFRRRRREAMSGA